MPQRPPNLFAGQYLDRLAHRRTEAEWLAEALRNPATLIVPFLNGHNLISLSGDSGAAWFLDRSIVTESSDPIFLGEFRQRPCFAVDISATRIELAPNVETADLRTMAARLPADEAGVLAYARALMIWRERHRYCGRCGAPTRSANAGHVLVCGSEACGLQQFPRIDPAVITLVTDTTGEHALLGRQASWPPRRYSTIAGFVEPGESLEDAVVREVHEETGVIVDRVEYHSSQPWPFPSSLMIGFIATARTTAIDPHDQELEDARWFSREDLASGQVLLPMATSVSFRLIEDWFDSAAARPLRDVIANRR
jgi:NAD+ diphosphatase